MVIAHVYRHQEILSAPARRPLVRQKGTPGVTGNLL
jgi:hypothetical protein